VDAASLFRQRTETRTGVPTNPVGLVLEVVVVLTPTFAVAILSRGAEHTSSVQ